MATVNSAIFVKEVTVIDPDTKGEVNVSIFKHKQSGGMFGIDANFLESCFEEEETIMITDPFNNASFVELDGI